MESKYNIIRTLQDNGSYKYEMSCGDCLITEVHSNSWPAQRVVNDMEKYMNELRRYD